MRGSSTTPFASWARRAGSSCLVSELAEQQADAVHNHKGPASKAAFDAEGKPTKAADGLRPRQGRRRRVASGHRRRQRLVRVGDRRGQGRLGGRGPAGAARATRREHRVAEVAAVGQRRRTLLAAGPLAARALRRRGRAGRVRRPDGRPPHATDTGSSRPAPSRCRRRVDYPLALERGKVVADHTERAQAAARGHRDRRGDSRRRDRGRAREDVRRGRQPRRVAHGRRRHVRRGVPGRAARDSRERDGEPPALLPGRDGGRRAHQPLHRRAQRRPGAHRRRSSPGTSASSAHASSDAAFFYREDLQQAARGLRRASRHHRVPGEARHARRQGPAHRAAQRGHRRAASAHRPRRPPTRCVRRTCARPTSSPTPSSSSPTCRA